MIKQVLDDLEFEQKAYPILSEIPAKCAEIFKKCYKFNEYGINYTNIGITEVLFATIFAIEKACFFTDVFLPKRSKKYLLKLLIDDVLSRMSTEFRFITRFEISQINKIRKSYYEQYFEYYSQNENQIKIIDVNEKGEDLECIEEPLISTLRGVLFFYEIDKMLLVNEEMPLAHGVDLKKYAPMIDISLYEAKRIAEKIYDYALSLADELNEIQELIELRKVENREENISGKKKEQQYEEDFSDVDAFLIILFGTIIIIFLVFVVNLVVEKQEYEKLGKIQDLTEISYEYKKNKDNRYSECLKELAKLTKKDVGLIEKDLQKRFEKEKKEAVQMYISKLLDTGEVEEANFTGIVNVFFENNKDLALKALEEESAKQSEEIMKNLINDWKLNPRNFENKRKKYIKTLFNNDVKKFHLALDEQLGYKEFSLDKQDMPISGIVNLYSDLPSIAPFEIVTKQSYLYNSSTYSNYDNENYFIKLVDFHTNKTAATIFVRGGEKVKIEVPLGSYKIKYAIGKTWYGETDLFGHSTRYLSSNIILNFINSGNYISGKELILYNSECGNASTKRISAEEF